MKGSKNHLALFGPKKDEIKICNKNNSKAIFKYELFLNFIKKIIIPPIPRLSVNE